MLRFLAKKASLKSVRELSEEYSGFSTGGGVNECPALNPKGQVNREHCDICHTRKCYKVVHFAPFAQLERYLER